MPAPFRVSPAADLLRSGRPYLPVWLVSPATRKAARRDERGRDEPESKLGERQEGQARIAPQREDDAGDARAGAADYAERRDQMARLIVWDAPFH